MSHATLQLRGWADAYIAELCMPCSTLNPRTRESKSFRYVDIDALDNERQLISQPKTLRVDEAPSRARMLIRRGDVLFSLVRPYLKNIAIVPPELDGEIASTAYCVLRPAPGISSRFLFFQFIQDSFIHSVPTYGNSPPAARDDEFIALKIHIAPSSEQLRIVAKIEELFSELDAGVAALERVKAKLKRYRAAVLKAAVEGRLTAEWRKLNPAVEPAAKLLERILAERRRKWEEAQLRKYAASGKPPPKGWREKYVAPASALTTDPHELPDGWCWASVDQVAEIQGGIQKQPKRAPRDNAFPYLRVANVLRDRLDLTEVHRFELFNDELERLRLREGDLLIVEGNGSRTEIGRSAIWKNEIADCVHQNHIIRVRFLAGDSKFANIYWNSPTGNGRVMEAAASTSGLYTLSVTKVSHLSVPLPPKAEQIQIIAGVDRRLSVVESVEAEVEHGLKRAARLRQAILKRAFEGKLVPQDPSDEPASKMLERIRFQRDEENHTGSGSGRTGSRKAHTRRGVSTLR